MGRNMVMRPEFGGGNYLESAMIVALVGWMRAFQWMLPVGIHLALSYSKHSQGTLQGRGQNLMKSNPVSPVMMSQLGSRADDPSKDARFARNRIEPALMSAVHGMPERLDRG